MLKDILLYRVLGMPTPEQRDAVKSGRKTWKRSTKQPGTEPADSANPWLSATSAETGTTRETPSTPTRSGGVFWEEHEESRKDTLWRYALRGGVAVILVLLLITGLRVWIVDGLLGGRADDTAAGPTLPETVAFPAVPAAGVAERFARAYLTWDEDNVDQRGTELARDAAPQSLAERAGWNGRGKQTVSAVATIGIDVATKQTARITVTALTTPSIKEGDQWKPQSARWQTLEIPVQDTGDRITVSGRPGLVAMPEPATIDPGDEPELDSAATTASQADTETFFEAYATEEDVSALSAPGSQLPGMNESEMKFNALTKWSVYAGDDKTRNAHAEVVWELPGGTTIAQPYDVRLVAVGDGDSTRWQVAAVKGGSPTDNTN